MPNETPITIKQALERIHATDYVLPAIQREFVWGPDRIARLFDSLMRGYPIGGFLLWKLDAETVGSLGLFRFLDRFSEFDHRHNEPLNLPTPRPLHAVLDGQQRLTALNVGLRGTFAYRLPRRWASRAESYPPRTLFLELCNVADGTHFGPCVRPSRSAEVAEAQPKRNRPADSPRGPKPTPEAVEEPDGDSVQVLP